LIRIKFGIRAWLLIVLTIKRSTGLCLTLDWSKKKRKEKKKHTVLITKKKTVHRHCSSSILNSGASSNHNGRPTTKKTCTSVPQNNQPFYINADHSQRSQVHVDLLPSTTRSAAATTVLCLRSKFANHQRHQLHPSSSTSRNATIHSALTFSSDNESTGPRPAATPQTPPPLPSHHRAQAKSRSPVLCAVADSSGNSSQKLGKQENRSCKHN